MIPSRDQLEAQFRHLDYEALLASWDLIEESDAPIDDFSRVVGALGLFADHELEEGDELLDSLTGDGSISEADVAFVRALRADLLDEKEEVVRLLWPHIDTGDGIHGDKMRLRLSDALLDLGRLNEISSVLEPYLQPPGTEQTLEAHLILLQGMVTAGVSQDQLVEQTSLIDTLLERGFRVQRASTALFYIDFLGLKGIVPLVEPLLKAHAPLLETYKTRIKEEVELLLELGEKHRIPAAVRAAASSYRAHPFPWESMDPEKATYLFASHEEHDAARLSILNSHPEEKIDKESELWGPLLLETYLSEKWEDTLELLDQHEGELEGHAMADQAKVMRPVCLYQIGKFPESWDAFILDPKIIEENAVPEELAARVFVCFALRDDEKLNLVVRRTFQSLAPDWQRIEPFIQAVLVELNKRHDDRAFTAWLKVLTHSLNPDENRSKLVYSIAHMAMEWGCESYMQPCADFLRESGDIQRALLVETHRDVWFQHDRDRLETSYREIMANSPTEKMEFLLLDRARMRRLLGDWEGTREDMEEAFKFPVSLPVHIASAILSSALRQLGGSREAIEEVEKKGLEWMKEKSRLGVDMASMQRQSLHAFHGDSWEAVWKKLQDVSRVLPDSIEKIRLSRLLTTNPATPPDVRSEATRIFEAACSQHHHPKWN